MSCAFDALVFLAPLERLRQSAAMPGLYGEDFLPELARRYRLLQTQEEIESDMSALGVGTVEELVTKASSNGPKSRCHPSIETIHAPVPDPPMTRTPFIMPQEKTLSAGVRS